MTYSSRSLFEYVLAVPLACSLLGLALSFWAHVETWVSDAETELKDFWILHLMLFALLMPVAVEVLSRKSFSVLLRAPRPFRLTVYALLAYYALNFYFFMYWSVDHLTSAATWRMMSSGWLLLFSIAALYYRTRLAEPK
jgi:hypothetical protein